MLLLTENGAKNRRQNAQEKRSVAGKTENSRLGRICGCFRQASELCVNLLYEGVSE